MGVTHVGSETTDGGAHTPTSESGERRGSTPDSIQALPMIEFPGLGDFTRRFERQSWRERHEEERRRLKQRFEVTTYSDIHPGLNLALAALKQVHCKWLKLGWRPRDDLNFEISACTSG